MKLWHRETVLPKVTQLVKWQSQDLNSGSMALKLTLLTIMLYCLFMQSYESKSRSSVLGELLQEMYKAGRLQMCLSTAEEEPCLTGTGVWILSRRQ